MGVPAFFRWLSRKYPSIVVNAVEERRNVDGQEVPVDATQPNPNFQEFDNLYLDMNGIIHPCTHPEDRPAPKNEDEMFMLIFDYIDRLFAIVRPRRLLYMAIDGVAPRAKMNQQRSRRFRASKEAADKQEEILNIRNELESKGIPLPPSKPKEEHFDSNCITPGTPFMARLAIALRYYVHLRVTNDPAWQNITVILSDANVPGEGEHKIMDFIRRQRASPSHDPNTVHCLCGADADLIMLGLATHEVNFNILREEFLPNKPRPCELCHQYGHDLKDCNGLLSKDDNPDLEDSTSKTTNFIFIRLPVLREYLERDLYMSNLPFEYSFERAIDDWVFMCFFVGNDFLPHLPSLEIREGAIDRLIKLYKDMVKRTGGWLTDNGHVFVERVEIIMQQLGNVEDEIFRNRQERELRFRDNQKRRKQQENRTQKPAFLPQSSSVIAPRAPRDGPAPYVSGAQVREQLADQRRAGMQTEQAQRILSQLFTPVGTKRSLKEDNDDEPAAKASHASDDSSWREVRRDAKSHNSTITSLSTTFDTEADEDSDTPEDNIRLWEEGWKDRYYRQKFGVSETDAEFRRKVAWAYTEGLCWVLKYYYQGCVSWDWYYPYHYAPFASDFDNISKFKPDWSKPTRPFNPLEQLMGVFPAASQLHIPTGWRDLMTSPDSPIFKFYPTEFKIDLNGKKFAWQGVALLPFVDEKLLLETLKDFHHTLTDEEKALNITGHDKIFVGRRHPLYETLLEVYTNGKKNPKKHHDDKSKGWISFDASLANGMAGLVRFDPTAPEPGSCYCTLFPGSEKFMDVPVDNCIMLEYRNPAGTLKGVLFPSALLDGAKVPDRVLRPADWDNRRNGSFKPTIGFSNNTPRANITDAGHRTLRHEMHESRNYTQARNPPYHRPMPGAQASYSDPTVASAQYYHHQSSTAYYPNNQQQQRNSYGPSHHQQPPAQPRRHQSYGAPSQPNFPHMSSFQQLALHGAGGAQQPRGTTYYGQPPQPPRFSQNANNNAPRNNNNFAQPPTLLRRNNGQGTRQDLPQQLPSANPSIQQIPANFYGAPPQPPQQHQNPSGGGYRAFFG